MECIIAEINLHKKKWALLSIYRLPLQDKSRSYHELDEAMDHLSKTFYFSGISITRKMTMKSEISWMPMV